MNKAALLKRDSAPDLLRIFAVICVIGVHAFMNVGFYDLTVTDRLSHFLCVTARSSFMVCVPLFLLLTGYLMNKKTLSAGYYKRIVPILAVYFSAVLINFFFKLSEGEEVKVFDIFFWFFGFEIHYSWYIEMYIGLFLLIPFLNILYNNLKNRTQKQILIFTLLLLTAIPAVFNIWDFQTPGALSVPTESVSYQKLLPSWWLNLYPLTYYFIGCFISEYRVRRKKRYLFPLLLLQLLFTGLFNFYRSYKSVYLKYCWADFYSVITAVTALLIFLLFLNLHTEKWNLKVKGFIKYFSGLTLGTYLVSFFFEDYFYEKLLLKIPETEGRLPYIPLMILLVFLGASALSAVINLILSGIFKLPPLIKKALKKN